MNARVQTIIGRDGLPTDARVGDEFPVVGSARVTAIEETLTVNVAPGEPNMESELRATLQFDVRIA